MLHPILAFVSVKTPAQLDALTFQTYIFGAVTGAVLLAIAALVANLIKFEGGQNPKDPGKRRMWYWALFVVTVCAFFLYNKFVVTETVNPNLQSDFLTTILIGSAVAAGVYLILGFILSKMMVRAKIGNWFNK